MKPCPRLVALSALGFLFGLSASADVTLAPLFQDHAVLQSGKDIPVWGWADPGETVTVSFHGEKASAVARADGRWVAVLPSLEVSYSSTDLTVQGNNTITLHDLLVGEVWICGGQSNMEFALGGVKGRTDGYGLGAENAEQEVDDARYALIRQFKVAHDISAIPVETAKGAWEVCSPETAARFTAVGYFFARDLHRRLGVPVGLINSTWGGTPVESWMSATALDAVPEGAIVRQRWLDTLAEYPARKAAFEKAEAEWSRADAAAAAAGKAAHEAFLRKNRRPRVPVGPGSPYAPECLFDGMIEPLVPYAFRGVIWYQGEANAPHADEYHALFASMITDWRARFRQGDFPFYFVQLADFKSPIDPTNETWAYFREAQAQTLSLPNTGMAVAIDIGNPNDIHPRNKQEVGRRLALIAKAKIYGLSVDTSGPVFAGAARVGSALRVSFTNAGTGLISHDLPVQSLELAGTDRKFHPASAKIEGATLLVSSPAVPAPVAVRYAWRNAPVANLYNGAGLPAVPFRSDTW